MQQTYISQTQRNDQYLKLLDAIAEAPAGEALNIYEYLDPP